jgi:hypothetical protein
LPDSGVAGKNIRRDAKSKDFFSVGEPLWLSGKVVKNEKINEIERTRVCSPPRATSLEKKRFFSAKSPGVVKFAYA